MLTPLAADCDWMVRMKLIAWSSGATNSPWHIDHALKRSGRFSEMIFIGAPDRGERVEIFKVHCKKIALLDKIDFKKLSDLSEGLSGADIQTVCKGNPRVVRPWRQR